MFFTSILPMLGYILLMSDLSIDNKIWLLGYGYAFGLIEGDEQNCLNIRYDPGLVLRFALCTLKANFDWRESRILIIYCHHLWRLLPMEVMVYKGYCLWKDIVKHLLILDYRTTAWHIQSYGDSRNQHGHFKFYEWSYIIYTHKGDTCSIRRMQRPQDSGNRMII